MAAVSSTYSFKDLAFVFTHPTAGQYLAAGKNGVGNLSVNMAADRTTHDRSADGTIMPSYISGDDGSITVEVQQTSALHQFFVDWYNLCKTAADNGDISNWAAGAITIRNLVDGSGHQAIGVSPMKNPDKPYQAQGQKVTWTLMCADLQTI